MRQIADERRRSERLEAQLSAANERAAVLEKIASNDKAQLRRDREELERALAASKKEVAAQSAERQRLLHDLSMAQQQLRVAESERDAAASVVDAHVSQLDASKRLTLELRQSLQQAEARATSLTQELERQRAVSRHQENQMQLLEGKLSRSIALDTDEWQRKRQEEESTWHQQLAALEHALTVERQQSATLQQQLDREKAVAKDTAEHAVARAQALSEELTTANLCIAERKKQWETLKAELEDARAKLESERSARKDCEARLALAVVQGDKRTRKQVDDENAVRSELEAEQQRNAQLVSQIESFEARFAEANAAVSANNEDKGDPASTMVTSGDTPRRQAQVVADLRVELARTRQKVAALEDKLAKRAAGGGGGSARRDKESADSKLGAREKRVAEEQRFDLLKLSGSRIAC
jgi:chromosome segregation ATPase